MTQWGQIRIAYTGATGALALFVACLACPPPLDAQFLTDLDPTFREARAAVINGLANNVGTLPSPSGGALTFRLDPTVGVFTRDSDTLGPIFTDRYQTTGKGRLTITGAYTKHTFDEIDGLDVRNDGILVLLSAPGRLNLLEIKEEANVDVGSIGALFGVTDTIDVGLTIPILKVKLKEKAKRIQFIDCVDPQRQLGCDPASFTETDEPLITNSSESTGIGDIALRGKWNFWQTSGTTGRMGSAFVLDVSLPTGDTGDKNQLRNPQLIIGPSGAPADSQFTFGDPPLGTGIVRVKPRLVFSGETNPGLGLAIGAHTFVGGELGTTEGITNDLVYGFGLDVAPQVPFLSTIQLTLVADFLGRHAFDVKRKRVDLLSNTAPQVGESFDDFLRRIPTADADTFTGSFGFKATPLAGLGSNLLAQVVVFVNFLVPLNDTGFRDGLTPTVGLEWNYAF
jgi:hypothetical protein